MQCQHLLSDALSVDQFASLGADARAGAVLEDLGEGTREWGAAGAAVGGNGNGTWDGDQAG